MVSPGNQPVEHGLEGLTAQLIVPVRLLLFHIRVLQVGADAVFKYPKLGDGIRDAQPRRQRAGAIRRGCSYVSDSI